MSETGNEGEWKGKSLARERVRVRRRSFPLRLLTAFALQLSLADREDGRVGRDAGLVHPALAARGAGADPVRVPAGAAVQRRHGAGHPPVVQEAAAVPGAGRAWSGHRHLPHGAVPAAHHARVALAHGPHPGLHPQRDRPGGRGGAPEEPGRSQGAHDDHHGRVAAQRRRGRGPLRAALPGLPARPVRRGEHQPAHRRGVQRRGGGRVLLQDGHRRAPHRHPLRVWLH
eukprot:scaffold799_cov220-Pinguiococcus_pyrenoidosus.AAC.7